MILKQNKILEETHIQYAHGNDISFLILNVVREKLSGQQGQRNEQDCFDVACMYIAGRACGRPLTQGDIIDCDDEILETAQGSNFRNILATVSQMTKP